MDHLIFRRPTCLVLLAGLVMMLTGCGEPTPKMFPVHGKITLDGKPLAEGTIYFTNVETGTVDPLPIKDGEYQGEALAGPRRVEVVAYRMIPISGPMGGEVQENLIAPRYNSDSQLTAEIKPTGPNEFNYEVHSK